MSEQQLSERIDALESRLMYQDETIEQLNATITAQWKQIDALTRQLAALNERLQQAEAQRAGAHQRAPAALLTEFAYAWVFSQMPTATATKTITAKMIGEIFLLLPLRGESLAAWLNSVRIGLP